MCVWIAAIVCVVKTGDDPEETGLWSGLCRMLVTHAEVSVQQSKPALKLWIGFLEGLRKKRFLSSMCVFMCNTVRDTLRGTSRRVSVPSVGFVVINMSDFSRVQSSSMCVCVLVHSYVVIKRFLTGWVCMSDNLDVMCGIHKQSFMCCFELVFYLL